MRGRCLAWIFLWVLYFGLCLPDVGQAKPKGTTELRKKGKKKKSKLSQKKFRAGLGLDFPDLLPFEFIYQKDLHWAFRGFIVPPLRNQIHVNLPQDILDTSESTQIEHPAMTVIFDVVYGPIIGVDTQYHPWGSDFYFTGGLAYRKLSLDGGLQSALIIRTNQGIVIDTFTQIAIDAKTTIEQGVFRTGVGWDWRFDSFYANLLLIGFNVPVGTRVKSEADAWIIASSAETTEDVNTSLESLRAEKKVELEDKIDEVMKPLRGAVLPMMGFRVGVRF